MKKWLLLLITLAAALPGAQAQGGRGFWHQEWCVEKGDSVPLVHILPVYVFSRPVDLRRYRKLVDAVKKVYPIARIAKAKMAAMEEELCRLPTKKAQKAYIRQVYNQIKEEYTPVLVLAKETNLDVLNLSTNVVLQLSVLMFLIPFVLLFLTDPKLKSLPKNLFLALLVGSVSLISQYLAARYMGAESPAIIGSILSIIVIVLYGKLTASKEEKARKNSLKTKDILNAWSIYLLILVLIILTSPLFPGLRHTLENNWITKISLPINASTVNYTISWLTHAGVLLFVGTFIGGLIQGAKVKDLFTVLWNTVKQLKKTFVTVICLVGLSTIMDASGMIAVIATALATATGSLYPLFAPVIGCLGTFITGSDTSSNILFGKLQASVAGQIHVSPDWLSAANTVGATGGKIISPQSIAIATSAGNQQGKEGEILKAAIPYALTYVLITGIIVYIFS